MTGPVDYAPFPTDPEAIKADIAVRRQAIRIMFAEITALKQRLGTALGPEAFLAWLAEEASDDRANAMGVANQQSTFENRDEWTLADWLDKDDEWKSYLKGAGDGAPPPV